MIGEREANKYVFDSDLTEHGSALGRKLAFASKGLRQELLRENPDSDEGRTSAAIEVQRAWRGYLARSNLYDLVQPNVSKTAIYSGSKHTFMRQDDFVGYDQNGKEKSAARLRLETQYKQFVQYLMSSKDRPSKIPTFDDFCANYIQDWWHAINEKRLRRKMGKLQQTLVVSKPQPHQSKPEPLKPKRPPRLFSIQEAASCIQKAWRRHIDIQVYRYYRDLINFKTRGNPALMLRCINPQEAKMLDPAAGIHIKFRLAGDRFPPNIYYKIFTHRPIQDLCANSPKDYTKCEIKFKMCKDQHNRGRPLPGPDNHSGWYKRSENNGWRLVSDRLIHHIMSDPVTWESSQKKYEYSHDKLVRKQDVEKRKKKKKIEWMQKMYKDGMLKAKSDDKETIQLIEGAAAGMVATVENYGPNALEDWEVDELLDWTTSLNFEDYQNGWKELATSANSEKQIVNKDPTRLWNRMYTASESLTGTEDKMRLFTSTGDPYEFTLSTGPSRYQSTQQSRNTPVSSVSSTQGRAQPVG